MANVHGSALQALKRLGIRRVLKGKAADALISAISAASDRAAQVLAIDALTRIDSDMAGGKTSGILPVPLDIHNFHCDRSSVRASSSKVEHEIHRLSPSTAYPFKLQAQFKKNSEALHWCIDTTWLNLKVPAKVATERPEKN